MTGSPFSSYDIPSEISPYRYSEINNNTKGWYVRVGGTFGCHKPSDQFKSKLKLRPSHPQFRRRYSFRFFSTKCNGILSRIASHFPATITHLASGKYSDDNNTQKVEEFEMSSDDEGSNSVNDGEVGTSSLPLEMCILPLFLEKRISKLIVLCCLICQRLVSY